MNYKVFAFGILIVVFNLLSGTIVFAQNQSDWNLGGNQSLPIGVEHRDVVSPSMNSIEVGVNVYTPLGYNQTDTTIKYPVVYFLHGSAGNEYNYFGYTSFDKQNPSSILGSENMIKLVENGEVPPTIIVFPNGKRGSNYIDQGVDKPETFIIEELIPYIDSNYNTIGTRAGRSIEGFSMGGGGAAYFGFKYPELFCTFIGYSPGPYGHVTKALVDNGSSISNFGMEYRFTYGGDQDLGAIKTFVTTTLPNTISSFNAGGGTTVYEYFNDGVKGFEIINGTGHNFGDQLNSVRPSTGESFAKYHMKYHHESFGSEPVVPNNPSSQCTAVFPDICGNVFESYITELKNDGVIGGYSDGTYKPDNPVTRAEMSKFIMNAFEISENTSCEEFPDVDPSNTFYSHIMSLKCHGVISGYSDGMFRPNDVVKRDVVTKFIVNGLAVEGVVVDLNMSHSFSDVSSNNPFESFIAYLTNQTIETGERVISGYNDGTYRPSNVLTRGEMSKIVNNSRKLQ
ncbi:S-layer homology domain-containing protein [Candidatus Dojkabacteria bacterium]|uniref:S-layer homology domain-containing protein n=1 Tax=Candidatus Dojkabacteria bacterium TaxID=2099670 RepID=A0A955RKJ5_9BACT|nr:S-layer homology domain-containing protein [Candidatus Dojkabacteria bacterium]